MKGKKAKQRIGRNLIRFDAKHAQKEHLSGILSQWSTLKEMIKDAFKLKNKGVHEQMLLGIKLYEDFLVQVSESTSFKPEEIQDYEILPLNGKERYIFIITNSNRYVASSQLNELFDETIKKIARLRIKSN